MKTTRLILLAGLCLLVIGALKAQVKIGDNPLSIGNDRLYEIERAGKLLIVTDSLEFGRTTSKTLNNPGTDALMLKLYGYGLGNFVANQSYFLGTDNTGQVLEFPLTMVLSSTSSSASLSLSNGVSNFTTVDLTRLDSFFVSNTQLRDSLNTVRNLIAISEASDGDTLTGNEWIDEITLSTDEFVTMTIYENTLTGNPLDRHFTQVDLGILLATDIELDSVATVIRTELADTTQVIRDLIDASTFYTANGTFTNDRVATGAGNSLTFTGIDSFAINADDIIITGTGKSATTTTGQIDLQSTTSNINVTASGNNNLSATNNSIIAGTDNTITSTAGNINLNASTANVNIDGNVIMSDYGAGTKTGSEAFLIGVTASGDLVDVSLDSIGGDAILSSPVDLDQDGVLETTVDEAIQAENRDVDSTIYKYNGTLESNRTLTGASFSLTFDGISTYAITNTTTLDVDATNVDMDGTTLNADYTNVNVTSSNDNTIVATNDNNLTATADNNISGANNIITAGTDNNMTSTAGNINLTAASGQVVVNTPLLDVNATTVDMDGTTLNADFTNINLTSTNNNTINATADNNLSANNTNITATNSNVISAGTSNTITSTTGNINLNAGAANVNIDGNVVMSDYGAGTKTGSETFLIGVTASGDLVDVSLDSIGGDAILSSPVDLDQDGVLETTVDEAIQAENRDVDSTIYKYDGSLWGNRTMNMASFNLYFVGSGGDTTVITDDGRIGIGRGNVTQGTGTPNDIRLDVNGDILANQVHSSSDARFKKNITPLDGALAKVMAINGVTYDFRVEEFPNRNFPESKQLGFIAQNVEMVLPEVVKTNNDGFKAVDYAKITALLNEAIKEQQAQISNQEVLIQSQQTMLSALLNQNKLLSDEMANIKAMIMLRASDQSHSEE